MPSAYDAFFRQATSNAPYEYQIRLAGGNTGRVTERPLAVPPLVCSGLIRARQNSVPAPR